MGNWATSKIKTIAPPKSPASSDCTLGVRISTYEFNGDANTQTIAAINRISER
jgi:hypothetical protein